MECIAQWVVYLQTRPKKIGHRFHEKQEQLLWLVPKFGCETLGVFISTQINERHHIVNLDYTRK